MAIMYPDNGFKKNDSGIAEPQLYEILKNDLDDEYHVIHSIPWISSILQKERGSNTPIGEIDFLIIHQNLGCLAIEVKGGKNIKHGKNGFYYDNGANSVNYFDPVNQLRRGIFSLQRIISKSSFKLGHCYFFPASKFNNDELPPSMIDNIRPDPIRFIIDSDDLKNTASKIKKIMLYFKETLNTPNLPLQEIYYFINKIIPLESGQSFLYEQINYDNSTWLKLTNQQKECCDRILEDDVSLISGWPGTGKTVSLIHAARNLSNKGKKTLILTFNNLLSEKIKHDLKTSKNCDVLTFHKLCGIHSSNTNTYDWLNSGAYEDLNKAVSLDKLSGYDCLLVDEGQAIKKEGWESLKSAFAGKVICIMLDCAQAFKYESSVKVDFLENIFNVSVFYLTESLRMPKRVCSRLHLFSKPNHYVCNYRNDDEHSLFEIITNDQEYELRKQIDSLISDGVKPTDICVLTPPNVNIHTSLVPNNIQVESIGKFRGLERPIVIIYAAEKMTAVDFFCSYSRATTKCICILDAIDLSKKEYQNISEDLMKSRYLEIEEKSKTSFSEKQILSSNKCDILSDYIMLSWNEDWNIYIVKIIKSEIMNHIFFSYLKTTTISKFLTWNSKSNKFFVHYGKTIDLDDYVHENTSFKICNECHCRAPYIFSSRICLKCSSYQRQTQRDFEFEEDIKKYNDILSNDNPKDTKNTNAIKSFGATFISTAVARKISEDEMKILPILQKNRVITKIIIIFCIRISHKGKEITNKEIIRICKSWGGEIFDNYQENKFAGYVNTALVDLEKSGYFKKIGKGNWGFL